MFGSRMKESEPTPSSIHPEWREVADTVIVHPFRDPTSTATLKVAFYEGAKALAIVLGAGVGDRAVGQWGNEDRGVGAQAVSVGLGSV